MLFVQTAPSPRSSSSCVEVLLAAGAAVDAPTADGQTPLLLACEAGRLDCVRVLLTAGADRSRTTEVSLPPPSCLEEAEDILVKLSMGLTQTLKYSCKLCSFTSAALCL